MARAPLTCAPDTTVQDAAKAMAARHVSSICVTEGQSLTGIVTLRDLSGKVVAGALPYDTPVRAVMTQGPLSLPPSAIGSDVLHMMMERRIGHVPVCDGERLVGIVTQTDLTRFQAMTSAELVSEIATRRNARGDGPRHRPHPATAGATGGRRQPARGRHAAHQRHRRHSNPPPSGAGRAVARCAARPLSLACLRKSGPAGTDRRFGSGQLPDARRCRDPGTDALLHALAKFVCEGLDTAGYVLCPGEMMATNPRWCQPVRVWREYFRGWIARPRPRRRCWPR